MTDLHVSRDTLSRKLARVQSLPMLSQLFNTAIEDGKLQTDSVLMNFLVNLAQNLNRTKSPPKGLSAGKGIVTAGLADMSFKCCELSAGAARSNFCMPTALLRQATPWTSG
jgi:hypothetical protein